MAPYLGDYNEDDTVHFLWSSNDSDGASITRGVDGTISVYKDGGVTQTVAGVTDTEDFDGLTGVHLVSIDLSADAFYVTGADYAVVLSAATIDGQTVNAVIGHFSIENRHLGNDLTATGVEDAVWDAVRASHVAGGSFGEGVNVESLTANGAADVRTEVDGGIANVHLDHLITLEAAVNDAAPGQGSFVVNLSSSTNDKYNGMVIIMTTGNAAGEARRISDYVGATKTLSVENDFVGTLADTDSFVIVSLEVLSGSGPTSGQVADAVWDEDVIAAHGTADTAGLLLRALGAVLSQRTNNATLDALLGVPDSAGEDVPSAVDTELTASHGAGSWAGSSSDIVVVSGEFVGTPTVSLLDTDLTEATDDHYEGLLLLVTSGAADGQSRWIESYNGTTKEITVSDDFVDAPAATDTFKILAIRGYTQGEEFSGRAQKGGS